MATSIDFMLIRDTEANVKANLADTKMAILSDATLGPVFRNSDDIHYAAINKYWDISGGAFVYNDITFKDITASGVIYADQYVKHTGDTDTLLEFSTNRIDLTAGNVTMLTLQETAQDIISVNVNNVDIDFRVGATGVANAMLLKGDNGNVGFGADPGTGSHLYVASTDIATTANWSGIAQSHTKATGASDYSDSHYSFDNRFILNQSGGVIGESILSFNRFTQTAGDVGAIGNEKSLYGGWDSLVLNGGTITNAAFGRLIFIDQAVGHTITGKTYGLWLGVDLDGTATDTAYLAYLECFNGLDYGIYQVGTSTNGNYFADHIYLADDKAVGISGGARFVFDATATPDSITVTDADLWIGDGKYIGLGAAKGRILFTDTTIDTFTIKDADLYLDGEKANIISVARSVTDTTGNDLTIAAGTAKASTADLDGGGLYLKPGISTGTGKASLVLYRANRAPSTSSSDNSVNDALRVGPVKHISNNTTTSIIQVNLPDLGMSGGQFSYSICCSDGTDMQVHTGICGWAAVSKSGTQTISIVEIGAAEVTAKSNIGVIFSDTFGYTEDVANNRFFITLNANCTSFTPTTLYVCVILDNNALQTASVL